jgi:hypothetical protein
MAGRQSRRADLRRHGPVTRAASLPGRRRERSRVGAVHDFAVCAPNARACNPEEKWGEAWKEFGFGVPVGSSRPKCGRKLGSHGSPWVPVGSIVGFVPVTEMGSSAMKSMSPAEFRKLRKLLSPLSGRGAQAARAMAEIDARFMPDKVVRSRLFPKARNAQVLCYVAKKS